MPDELAQRVSRLEAEVSDLREDVADIKRGVQQAATRTDLSDLRKFFVDRDQQYNEKLWRLCFGLVIVIAIMAAISFGVKVGDMVGLWAK